MITKTEFITKAQKGMTLAEIADELQIGEQELLRIVEDYEISSMISYYRMHYKRVTSLSWVRVKKETSSELKKKRGEWVRKALKTALSEDKTRDKSQDIRLAALSKKHEDLKKWIVEHGLEIPENL